MAPTPKVVKHVVGAVRRQLEAGEAAKEAAARAVQVEYHSSYDELLKALKAAHKGRVTVKLDIGSRSRLSQVVSNQVMRSVALLAQAAPKALHAVVDDAQVSLFRFFGRVMGVDLPAVKIAPSQSYYNEIETMARRAAGVTGIDLREAVMKQIRLLKPGEDTVARLIDTAASTFLDQDWRVKRLVVTEAAWAFNGSQERALEEVAPQFPGIRMRWTELINDLTGAPLDNRVAKDSMAMHGQAVLPGSLFVMPNTDLAPKLMVGKSWRHPPNRPHDRAILVPWLPSFGVPAWAVNRDGVKSPLLQRRR